MSKKTELEEINKDINSTLDNITRLNGEIFDYAKKSSELLDQQSEKLDKIDKSVNVTNEKISGANNTINKIMSDKKRGFFNGIAAGATTTGIAVTAGAFATGNIPLGISTLVITGIIGGGAAIINKFL